VKSTTNKIILKKGDRVRVQTPNRRSTDRAKQEFKESIAAHGEKSLWNESHLITAQKRIDWINSQEFASKAIQMASEANWDEIGLEYED